MKKIKLIIFIVLLINSYCSRSNENIQNEHAKIYLVKTQKLFLRSEPDINSKIITLLYIDDKLELIEKTNVYYLTNGMNRNWFKVKSPKNRIGYVFSGFLKEYNEDEYKINDKPFDIIGYWAEYFDPPNQIYYFLEDNVFKRVLQNDDNSEKIFTGKYKYNGIDTIFIKENDKIEYIMKVVIYKGKTTLKYDNYIFDTEYHGKE